MNKNTAKMNKVEKVEKVNKWPKNSPYNKITTRLNKHKVQNTKMNKEIPETKKKPIVPQVDNKTWLLNKYQKMKRHLLYRDALKQNIDLPEKYQKLKKDKLVELLTNANINNVEDVKLTEAMNAKKLRDIKDAKMKKRTENVLKKINRAKQQNEKTLTKVKDTLREIAKQRRETQKILEKMQKISIPDLYHGVSRDKSKYIMIQAKVKFYYKSGSIEWKTNTYKFEKNKILKNNEIDKKIIQRSIENFYFPDDGGEGQYYDLEDIEFGQMKGFSMNYSELPNIKFKQLTLQYKFLENLVDYVDKLKNDNECLIRYVVNKLAGKPGFVNFTIYLFKQQLSALQIDYSKGLSVNELILWVTEYYNNYISVYALDPYYNCFKYKVAPSGSVTYILSFICNNQHIYPIYNDQINKFISKAKRMNVEAIDCKFKYTATDYRMIKTLNNDKPFILIEHDTDLEKENDFSQEYKDLISGELKGQVFIVENVLHCAQEIIKTTNYTITNIKIKDGEIVAFIHPISEAIIESGREYASRKQICEKLHDLIPSHHFKFKNQSYTQLANEYFKIKYGDFGMMSQYNDETLKITDNFGTCPIIRTLTHRNMQMDYDHAFDIRSCYPNAVKDMEDDYPVFGLLDVFKEYNNEDIVMGEYLVKSFKIEKFSGLDIQKQIMSYQLVQYLLDNEFIQKSDILLFRKASFGIKCKTLKKFMTDIMDAFPRDKYGDHAKLLCNSFIGGLGRKYVNVDKGFVTNDFETVCAMFYQNEERDKVNAFTFTELDGMYFVRETAKTRMNKDHGPVHRQILGQSMISVFELLKMTMGPESQLIWVNTDAIGVRKPITTKLDNEKYKKETWKPKKYKLFVERDLDDKIEDMKEWNQLNDIQFKGDNSYMHGLKIDKDTSDNYINELKNKTFCCTGMPGCQKTTLLKKLYVPDETLVLCYTNKACQNIIQALGKDANVHTFHSEFFKQEESKTILKNIKRIQIDEFSMVPLNWLNKLYQLKKDNNIIIQMYGDPDQCRPVDIRYFDYVNKKVFRELCDNNLLVKEYVKGCSRYDSKLYQILKFFKANQCLPLVIKDKCIDMFNCANAICKINDTRKRVCKAIWERLGKKCFKIGDKIISNINNRIVYNSRFYYVHDIKDNKISVIETKDGEPLKGRDGQIAYMNILSKKGENNFDPANCITCYRYQGDTIEGKYNIHDVSIMDFNEFYTSLSRGRKLDDIYFNYTDKIFQRATEPLYPTYIKQKKCSTGFVYELHNEVENKYYIGCTERTVEQRFEEHKQEGPILDHGQLDDWKCKQIGMVYFQSNEELLNIEKFYIEQYQSQGHELINTQKLTKSFNVKVTAPSIYNTDKKFKIVDTGKFFSIRYTLNGGKFQKKVRYGKRLDKNDALSKITKTRLELLEKYQ